MSSYRERPLRVAYFVGAHKSYTGSQQSLAVLVKSLPTSVVDPVVIFAGEGEAEREFNAQGICTETLGSTGIFENFGWVQSGNISSVMFMAAPRIPALTVRLARLLKVLRIDIVHANDFRGLLTSGWAARLCRLPLFWHVRGELRPYNGTKYVQLAKMLSPTVITVAGTLEEQVPDTLPTYTIYNAVSDCSVNIEGTAAVEEVQCRHSLKEDALKVVSASSFTPYKGLHHLVEAVGLLLGQRPDLRRRLAVFMLGEQGRGGSSKYVEELVDRISRYGLHNNIFLVGWQSDPLAWMAAADVAVLPTVSSERFVFKDGSAVQAVCTEGLPRVVLDAFGVGTPVIASDVAGVREVVRDGQDGFVITPGEPDVIAYRMEVLIKDFQLLKAMGISARERAGKFSVENMVESVISLYRSAAQNTSH
jgi:glycosyltransferase involved in cell wall biosynthesis